MIKMIVFLSSQLQPDVATIVVTPPSVLKMLPMIVGRSPTGFEVLSTIVDCSPRIVAKSATIVF